MPIYRAIYEFQTEAQVQTGTAGSVSILYRAEDGRGAVEGSVAFWKNRGRSIPDHFHRCCAVAVSVVDPAPLEPDGSLAKGGEGRRIFEWKVITGLGPGVTSRFSGELASLPFDPVGDPYNEDRNAKEKVT